MNDLARIPTRALWRIVSFELSDDPALVASAAPGEQPWKAVLALEGVKTGDRRMIEPNALDWRDLPLTLGYQETTPSGFNPHGDAEASGRIETITRNAGASDSFTIDGTGVFTADEIGQRAAKAVRDQKLRGVSVDVTQSEVRYDAEIDPKSGELLSETEVLTSGQIMGAIVTAHPAFEQALIEVDGDPIPEEDAVPVAASARRGVPIEFFENPNFDRLTPFTVEATTIPGVHRVFGHIAPRDQCHLGLPGCKTAPFSASNYSFFHTKRFECADGTTIHVGCLTLGGLHTPLRTLAEASEFELQRSFEDATSTAAFIRAYDDEFGVAVAGVTRMGLSEEDVELLAGSSPSGEWKPIRGSSEMIRIHNVPVPAFPVPLTASALFRDGEMVAFRSAGVPSDLQCEDASDEPEAMAASALGPDVRSTLFSIVERLDRIEKTQRAQVRFSEGIPEKI